jgi:leader peptidase (prepilin peptidase)/N-methyltransferase
MRIAAVLLWMLALAGYDVHCRRLPNWLTLPGFAVIVLVATCTGHGVAAILGATSLGAAYLSVHLVSPTAMGGGDVKLALGLGALTGCFGTDVWFLSAVGAPLLTAATAVLAVLRRTGPSVPHGPSMCLASVVAMGLALLS